jgi:hypothetical protein
MVGALLSANLAYGDFLPPNNLHLQDRLHSNSGITEEQFNSVIDQLEVLYGPIIGQMGAKLNVNRRWTDATVNASASRFWDTWTVNMYGGLARRPEVTADGFALVMCHELGHHLGGFPYVSSWAANEGQSDYFATLACGRMLWKNDVEGNAATREVIDAYPKAMCDDVWSTEADQNLCYRSMLAGYSLGKLLGTLGGTPDVSFETPDTRVVTRTNNAHPRGQCRLDTYAAGALCVNTWDDAIIPATETASAAATCTASEGFETGLRPLCWFKPTM